MGHTRNMRLPIDYSLQWFIDDGLISAIAFAGKKNVSRGKATFYSNNGYGVIVEIPVQITSVRFCAAIDLSEDDLWATGAPGLEAFVSNLRAEGHDVTEYSPVTVVYFKRGE